MPKVWPLVAVYRWWQASLLVQWLVAWALLVTPLQRWLLGRMQLQRRLWWVRLWVVLGHGLCWAWLALVCLVCRPLLGWLVGWWLVAPLLWWLWDSL